MLEYSILSQEQEYAQKNWIKSYYLDEKWIYQISGFLQNLVFVDKDIQGYPRDVILFLNIKIDFISSHLSYQASL